MKDINYWTEDKKNNVNSKLPYCAAKDYYTPHINKIATKITPDSGEFIPIYSESSKADIRANTYGKQIQINKNGYSIIDCGFSIEIPAGYKISICTTCELLKQGVFLRDMIDENKRIKVLVINNGNESFIIEHKDLIGQIFIEPIYYFEWEMK